MKKPFAFLRRQQASTESFVEWPFFLILTFALGFVYVESLFANPALQEPGRLILFTVLMTAHIVFHWLSVRLPSWKWVTLYLIIQGTLAFFITFMSRNIGPLLGLYMGLIGETIGLLREKPRWSVVTVAVFLALSFLNYGLQVSWIGWYWWLLAMGPMTFFVAVYVTLYSRQTEARARAQTLLRELEAANRQLSDYAGRVEDLTIANERQRMARELHDTLSQGLAGLILQLEAVEAHLAGNRMERARSILRQSMERARETLADARLAIDDLRHNEKRNIEEAVRQEIDHFTDSTGIPCTREIEFPMNIPEQVSETVIRVAEEGLTNIARHANAYKARLRITYIDKKNTLEMEISDDGIGFDPQQVEAGHYGLLGMRERVRLVGGNLDVHSAPGNGTQILIRFPLEDPIHE